jgi:hypothetical protein
MAMTTFAPFGHCPLSALKYLRKASKEMLRSGFLGLTIIATSPARGGSTVTADALRAALSEAEETAAIRLDPTNSVKMQQTSPKTLTFMSLPLLCFICEKPLARDEQRAEIARPGGQI